MTVRIIEYSYPGEKPNTENLAVALGYFDGVHLGHRKLIATLVDEAKKNNLTPCIFTFGNSLSKIKNTQTILYNTEEKLSIFEEMGIEVVIVSDFASISSLTPEDFVNKVLVNDLSVKLCAVGYNFRFGKKASGDANDLKRLMEANGCSAICIDEETVFGNAVSSTIIRSLLAEKRVEDANALLGIPYFIRGVVERGLGLGKHFGFPTVNTPLRGDSPLAFGVYRTAVRIGDELFTGITNIGSCPTVKEREAHAETLIADFSGDLYGKEIRIYLLEYLREERKFDSIEELKAQIHQDRDLSKIKNGDLKWLEIGLNLQ